MKILYLKLIACFTKQKLVWIKDWDGQVILALAKVNPWGELCAQIQDSIYLLFEDGSAERYAYKVNRNISWKYYQ